MTHQEIKEKIISEVLLENEVDAQGPSK